MGNNGIVRLPVGENYRLLPISDANNIRWVLLYYQQGVRLMVGIWNTSDIVAGIGSHVSTVLVYSVTG